MVLEFSQWITKNSQIGRKSENGLDIDIGAGRKIRVFASDAAILSQVQAIDNVSVRPIDVKAMADLENWRANKPLRHHVVKQLTTFLQETGQKTIHSKDAKAFSKTKVALRMSALKNLASLDSSEQFLPGAAYSLVLTSTHPSLLALANQLIPHLLSGIALTVISTAATSIHVAYLIDLLLAFGLSSASIVYQLIDFEATHAGQSASFILLESADIDSVLDTALTSNIIYGIACIKIFADESLKSAVQKILQHKLEIQYPEGELFFEDELFPQSMPEIKVKVDPVHFETSGVSGVEVFYIRSPGEALKMVNHLAGPLGQQFVSIWSEKTGLALKIAQGIKSCKQVSINGIPPQGSGRSSLGGWQFELIAASALSRLVADNAESLSGVVASPINGSWSSTSVANRMETVHFLLDSLQLSKRATLRQALQRTAKEVDEDASANNLFIIYYEPIGKIIVQLSEEEDETALLSFGLNAIIFGNALIIAGKEASTPLETWKKIEGFLVSKGYPGVVQTVVQQGGASFNVKGATSKGALQLLADNGQTLQGLYLDEAQFQQDLYNRVLRRVQRSITLTLAEYDMTKIVE